MANFFKLRFLRTDKDDFAEFLRGRLVAAGERRPVHYDATAFALHIGAKDGAGRQTVRLQDIFAGFSQMNEGERPAALLHIIASIVEGGRPARMPFSEARDRLLPLIRSMTDIGMRHLQEKVAGRTLETDLPHRKLTPHIVAVLTLDGGETIAWITGEELDAWDITFEDAFAVALTNLRSRGDKPFVAVSPGLYGSGWADGYDASRLLLPDLIAALPVKGAAIAMAPNRDVLLVTGAEDEEGLRAMARSGQNLLGHPRPLSLSTLRLDADTWHGFEPDPSRPGETGLTELQEVQTSIDYAGQKALLDAAHIGSGEDIYVGTFSCLRDRATGQFAGSFATWTEGVDTLLPRAQKIVFVLIDSRQMIDVAWEKAMPIVSDLLEPAAFWPERFRARRFPSAQQLEELRAVANDVSELPAESAALAVARAFDPSVYPQSYKIVSRWRLRWIILSLVVIGLGLGGIAYAVSAFAAHAVPAMAVAAISLAFILPAAYAIASMLTWRLTLLGDAVETSSFLRTRRLQRDEIKGYRANQLRQISVVVPVDPGHRTMRVLPVEADAPFVAWFSGLRDLDIDDLQASEAEIAANPAFGRTPEDRLRRLTFARKIATGFTYVTAAALAWCFLAPEPYAALISVLVAIPLLALALAVLSRGLFRIDHRPGDAHANLGFAFFLPGLALMVRALLDLDMVDWLPAIAAGGVAGVILIGIAAVADRNARRRPWIMLGSALLAGVFGFGAIVEANALLDQSPPSVFASPVISKHISRGKVTRHIVELAPWGPRTEASEVTVPKELYDSVQTGSPVCMLLLPGRFGMPWFIAMGCP